MENQLGELPVTDDINTVSTRFRKMAKRHRKDPRFMKKLNAPLENTSCSIDSFVTINSSSKGKSGTDTVDDAIIKDASMEWRCDSCNQELLYIRKDAQRVCPSCGLSTPFQEMTKEDIVRQGYVNQATYLYKRQNHFKTWLKRTQGKETTFIDDHVIDCLLYTSPSPRDGLLSRMPSSA